MTQLYQFKNETPEILKNGRADMFARFFEGIKQNEVITSSPCESINAEIRKLKTEIPIKIFHHLEVIGFNRCLDLLSISTEKTPYFLKRLEHVENKAQNLQILKDESYGTSRVVVDPRYKIDIVRWEVNTRNLNCVCGKFTDRGFPCAHMVKAFNDLNQPYEHCIHPCYYTLTIRKALQNLNSPVSLGGLEIDKTIHPPPSHVRNCRTKRYLFGFEKSVTKK